MSEQSKEAYELRLVREKADELRLLGEKASHSLHLLQQKYSAKEAECYELEARIASREKEVKEVREELAMYKEQLTMVSERSAAQSEERMRVLAARDDENYALQGRVREAEARVRELEGERGGLQGRVRDHEMELARVESNLQARILELEAENSRLESDVLANFDYNHANLLELESLKRENMQLRSDYDELEMECRRVSSAHEELTTLHSETQLVVSRLEQENSQARADLASARDADAEVQALRRRLTEDYIRIEDLELKLREQEQINDSLRARLAKRI
jgi:chromosome segregation ATPase